MNHKLLIIIVFGLTAIGSSLLLSTNQSELEPQKANMAEIIATPTPTKTTAPKVKSTPNLATPLLSASPTPVYSSTPSPSPSFFPAPTSLPTYTPVPTPTPTPVSTPSPTPEATPTPVPSGSSQHTFYTSFHWKAKYYYCDTDNNWKDLSPTYLKFFSSEAELLANYSRTLHEPCKD